MSDQLFWPQTYQIQKPKQTWKYALSDIDHCPYKLLYLSGLRELQFCEVNFISLKQSIVSMCNWDCIFYLYMPLNIWEKNSWKLILNIWKINSNFSKLYCFKKFYKCDNRCRQNHKKILIYCFNKNFSYVHTFTIHIV